MRKVMSIEDKLKNIPYPEPGTNIQIEPLVVTYVLPEYVFTTENDDVNVGVWDEKEQQWATEFIDDINYDKSTRQLTYTTIKLAPMAFLQPRTADFPYKKWKLRCIENEVALLDIETKRVKLVFEIGVRYVKLIENTEIELKDIANVQMSPGVLLMELSKCGIHLLPVDEDAK